MKFHLPKPSPALGLSFVALFVALGGSGYAATQVTSAKKQKKVTVYNSKRLGGLPASAYLQTKHFGTSNNEHFLSAGQTATLGSVGHFTFTATCSHDAGGQNQVTFDVTANTTADLDGNGPSPAGTKVNIHTNSDALDTTPAKPLHPGDFDQVGSASSSTEIAADGQEVDIFYNDGVNWPSGNGSPSHDCFAGFSGLRG